MNKSGRASQEWSGGVGARRASRAGPIGCSLLPQAGDRTSGACARVRVARGRREMVMSATDINEAPRSRAAELADNLADQVLRVIAAHPGISVSALRRELEPLDEEKRALLHLAIYNLINSKRLELTAKRELHAPPSEHLSTVGKYWSLGATLQVDQRRDTE